MDFRRDSVSAGIRRLPAMSVERRPRRKSPCNLDSKAAEMDSAVPGNSARIVFYIFPRQGASQSVWEDLPMGRKILDKLRSREGASLTFALLAFLVCAAISAVLVAAGMASAGRLSGLAEADQRYYAVTSAAQLFCDSLKADAQTTQIKRITVVDEWDRYIYNAVTKDYSHTHGAPETATLKVLIGSNDVLTMSESDGIGGVTNLRKTSFLTDATLTYLIGKDEDFAYSSVVGYMQDRPSLVRSGNAQTELNTWTFSISGPDDDCLPVSADATMYGDGRIEVDFSNDSEDGKAFTVRVTLNPVLSAEKVTGKPGTWEANKDNNDVYMEFTRQSETTRTVSISWTVSNIKKVS